MIHCYVINYLKKLNGLKHEKHLLSIISVVQEFRCGSAGCLWLQVSFGFSQVVGKVCVSPEDSSGSGSSSKITPMLGGGVQRLAGYWLEAPSPVPHLLRLSIGRLSWLSSSALACNRVQDRSHCLSGCLITEVASHDYAMLGLVGASHWVQPTL